jgi:membrane-bound lytic murein transglycosylase D
VLGLAFVTTSRADPALVMSSPESSAKGSSPVTPVAFTLSAAATQISPAQSAVPEAATLQELAARQSQVVAPQSGETQAAPVQIARQETTTIEAITAAPETQPPAPIREAMIVAPDAPYGDLWERIRAGFGMNELKSRLIRRHERWYASHPDYVLRMSERARRYLYYIMEEVDRRGMPSEIALLPIIESAFNPGANSAASAAGIWQFIPSTGKHFGMEQNWWHDERRDIIGATNGALDYLQKLHDRFGDWELALAAYNWGENGVIRAQAYNRRHHRKTDYAHLRMPRETRNYIPKLLAIKHIIADPAHFGLTLASIPDEPYFDSVSTKQHMDVKVAAELAGISVDEFMALNPGHNRPVILQEKDSDNVLLLPVDKIETFRENLAKTNQRLVSWQPYESKKGESFKNIADHFGLTLAELRSANGLSKYARESNGQTLLVPIGDDEPATTQFEPFNMQPSAIAEMYGAVRYRVRRGDTISAIARRFHVSQRQLIEENHGRTFLRIGQHFNIVLADHRGYRRHHRSSRSKHASRHKSRNLNIADSH